MTVSYQYDVASSTSGGFTRLLFKWKGSLYKLIHFEMVVFLVSYYLVSILYRFGLDDPQKRKFEQVAFYCDTYMNYIPLSFILGFYVSFVASRWWNQYAAIPWPDRILYGISLYVQGNDEKGRIMRRTMVRYLNLSLVLVLRSISSAVKQRFPTLEHLVKSGFMNSSELKLFNSTPSKEFNTYWIPFTWFTSLIKEARTQKMLVDNPGTKLVMQEFYNFREKCGLLWSYDWVSIPLVYTQVVTIATYSFFMAACVARQFVDRSPIAYRNMINLYIPIFTMLQFFFYMGLLKVAEQLIDPFGDDDEDFELNWIIDRHTKVSYLIVDTLISKSPPLTKDIFFDEDSPELPYTEASVAFKKKTYRGSAHDMIVPDDKQTMVLPNIDEEEEELNEPRESISKRPPTLSLIPEMIHSKSDGILNHDLIHTKSNNISTKDIETEGSKVKSNDGSQEEDANRKFLNDFSFINKPLRDAYLNIEDGLSSDEIDTRRSTKNKNSFWMPTSLHGKLAVKKKPVVKWRPYKRPGGATTDENITPTELSAGEFEEECAFMWRTILEESESVGNLNDKHSPSNISNQAISDRLNGCKSSSNSLNSLNSKEITEVIKKSLDMNHDTKIQRLKRVNHKFKGRTRHGSSKQIYKSLPILTDQYCGEILITTEFLKSLSFSSYFFNAISHRIREEELQNKIKRQPFNSKRPVSRTPDKLDLPTVNKADGNE